MKALSSCLLETSSSLKDSKMIDKGECEEILENCEFFLNKVKETIKELQT